MDLKKVCHAELHKNKNYVLNLDLADFFTSINFGRVRGFFIKNKYFQLNPKIATIIAKIACHNNALPQGSPCSPVISNLIGQILDIHLVRLAKKHQCTYTRYADDLTFSTNQKNFPRNLSYKKNEKQSNWLIGTELLDSIINSGFQVNQSKTRMQYKNSRQVVTGLVVNKVVNTKSEYYRYARSMCHSLFTTGIFTLPSPKPDKHESKSPIVNKGIFPNLRQKIRVIIQKIWRVNTNNIAYVKLINNRYKEVQQQGSINQLEGIIRHIFYVKNYRNKYAQRGFRKSRHDGFINPKKDNDKPQYPPLNRNNQYSDES